MTTTHDTQDTAAARFESIGQDNARMAILSALEATFAEKVAKDGLLYTIEWAEATVVAAHRARLHEIVASIAAQDGQTILSALTAVRHEEMTALLHNRYRGASSSAFDNASDAAHRQASGEFVQWADHAVSYLTELL